MELAIGAVIIVAVGLLIIKVVIGLSRKALTKTTLDESIYAFILNVLKIAMYIILTVVLLGHLKEIGRAHV